MLAELTLIPTNSAEEAGRIIENYKIYENKPPDLIKERKDPEILQQVLYIKNHNFALLCNTERLIPPRSILCIYTIGTYILYLNNF